MSVEHVETVEEEEARLVAESAVRDELIAKQVQFLQDEGMGDGLHGILTVLLNPALQMDNREDAIVDAFLRVVAIHELSR